MNPRSQPFYADVFVREGALPALKRVEAAIRRDAPYETAIQNMSDGIYSLTVSSETEIDTGILYRASEAEGLPLDDWRLQKILNPPT